jgi:hypothetical protein
MKKKYYFYLVIVFITIFVAAIFTVYELNMTDTALKRYMLILKPIKYNNLLCYICFQHMSVNQTYGVDQIII